MSSCACRHLRLAAAAADEGRFEEVAHARREASLPCGRSSAGSRHGGHRRVPPRRCFEQHLLLRGSRDYVSQEAYELWLTEVMEKANRLRSRRLVVERPLRVERLAEYTGVEVGVSSWSTIRVKRGARAPRPLAATRATCAARRRVLPAATPAPGAAAEDAAATDRRLAFAAPAPATASVAPSRETLVPQGFSHTAAGLLPAAQRPWP
jgi:hypothetical protein